MSIVVNKGQQRSISVKKKQWRSIGVNQRQKQSIPINNSQYVSEFGAYSCCLYLGSIINPKNHKPMATFEKGILGGFSGKVGNVVGARWRGKNVMRSLPQRGSYTPTEAQLLQRERFATVVEFLSPIKDILSKYYGKQQGDKSSYNLATSYHLKNALIETPEGFAMDYPKVLISKGDLREMDSPQVAPAASQVIDFEWTDNSGQGNANATDQLVVVFYAPDLNLFQTYEDIASREDESAQVTLPAFYAGNDVQIWATFVTDTHKLAATSSYLGVVTVS